ncbi:hypothetical protein [Paraburkholderia sp. MM6662-R1]|uniref:hypothetical protein n=1 Tax=Paraburkholderia sp. MM6662-R1 TaxID=2991066 RepID=UPI003D24B73D
MWICLNNAFLSIVATPGDAATLTVRARRKGDIEAVFGQSTEVVTLSRRDYQFRAHLPRGVVSDAIASHLFHIDYGNFKDSVADASLHDAYVRIWSTMAALQEVPPYGTEPRKGFNKHPVR